MDSRPLHFRFRVLLAMLAMSMLTQPLLAQHGHPIVGTWSGFMNRAEGQPLRALLTFDFSVDQVISGALIVNGRRFPISSATLDPQTWTVAIEARGQNRAGDTLTYRIDAAFENLDSPTERTLLGTWHEGNNAGDFRIVIN